MTGIEVADCMHGKLVQLGSIHKREQEKLHAVRTRIVKSYTYSLSGKAQVHKKKQMPKHITGTLSQSRARTGNFHNRKSH